MTVEMNPPGAEIRPHSGSVKSNNIGAQELEDISQRLSDDIYSLNSWSDNLSSSSSSESVSHHGSSSRYGGQQQDVRSKTQGAVGKMLSIGKAQKNKAHNSSKKGSKFSSKEFESTAMSSNNYEYQYEASMSDPEISVSNKYGHWDAVDGSHHQLTKRNVVNTVDTVSKTIDKSKAVSDTAKHKEILDPSKLQAQRLYPDLEALKALDSQGNALAVSQSSSPSFMTEVNSGVKPSHSQNTRRPYFDFQKLPDRHSKNVQMHSADYNLEEAHKPFSLLSTTSHQSHQHPGMPGKLFDKRTTKEDHVHHQSSGSLAGRLHKSQPSIASEPHLKRQPKSSSDLESLRLSFEHRLEPENVKTKVKSVWNNIKYAGWTLKPKPSFKCDSPLYILGKRYHRKKDDISTDTENQFLRDFISRIWLTYRSNFYPIPGTKLSTDCGWGCMLRSGQMLIAQCLVTHFLGRDWRLYNKQTEAESLYYREIIRWFSDPVDTPSDKTPFCLHHLANFGRVYNKDPGEWYGPASVAYIFRDAFIKARHTVPLLSQLCIYVAQDCTVYIDDVIKLCTERQRSESASSSSGSDAGAASSCGVVQSEKWQRSLIILIPIRLGGELMNEIYIPCVRDLLSQENCMGIIGGKPKHSLYFIGWQDDKLIYLDPHLCREAVDTSVTDFRIETYHCMTPRKLSVNKIDPSCTVGFYIRDGDDFKNFMLQVRQFVSPPSQKGAYPLFIFADGHLNESSAQHNYSTVDKRVKVTHYQVDQNGQRRRTFSGDSEEFVML